MLTREHVEAAAEVAKASPPVAYAGMHIYGYPIGDWVSVIIGIYTVVQLYFLLRNKFKDKEKKAAAHSKPLQSSAQTWNAPAGSSSRARSTIVISVAVSCAGKCRSRCAPQSGRGRASDRARASSGTTHERA